MTYRPPLASMLFTLRHVAGLDRLMGEGGFPDLSMDLAEAILGEAGKLAEEVWAPLNRTGDAEGTRLENGRVFSPKGFAEAYRAFAEGGWTGLAAPVAMGGQGLPFALDIASAELWASANMALSLCPILSRGAIAAIGRHGTAEQKRRVLPKLTSGSWTGTMNLTEPQAGSDVGALRTRAEPVGDGTYRLTGTKIFITWGEHEMAENIVHLVLARLPGAPEGTGGISLFLVPKFLINPDGSLGARNDLRCVGIEEKLGIHASPTCVMSYGEETGALGTLIGAENRGMACMFTMMNDARLNVGVQGLSIAEAAFQKALAFAQERRQGRAPGIKSGPPEPILIHPDVRRMLGTMKALIEAARALCYATAIAADVARLAPDDKTRQDAQARADLLTPVAKSWCTDRGVEVASLGVQVHGGMGYVEETGAAQFLRDARIAPIYEGTNGIQAIDLLTRKLPLQGGGAIASLIGEIRQTARALSGQPGLEGLGAPLGEAAGALEQASAFMLSHLAKSPEDALAGASPYLDLLGNVLGGHFLGQGALAESELQGAGPRAALAGFYRHAVLGQAPGLAAHAMAGAEALRGLDAKGLSF